jgi:ABC-type branched-subunit amino acid transport system substrate-binding protein
MVLTLLAIVGSAAGVFLARSSQEPAAAAAVVGPLVDAEDPTLEPDICKPSVCAATSPAHVCIGGKCISAASAVCPVVRRPNPPSDKDILIASISSGGAFTAGIALATDEHNAAAARGGGRIVLVECNSEGDPEKATAAAKHVAVTLGAPIVLSSDTGAVLKATEDMVSQAGRVLVAIGPSDEPVSGKHWNMGPSAAAEGGALGAWLKVRQPKKLVVVARDDAHGKAVLEPVRQAVDTNRSQVTFELVPEGELNAEAIDAVVVKALSAVARPDVVAIIGALDGGAMLAGFKGKVPAKATFVVSEGRKDELLQFVESVDNKSTWAPFRKKLHWTGPSGSGPAATGFLDRFAAKHDGQRPAEAAPGYDAIYAAVFALNAVSEPHGDLSKALVSLAKGPVVPVGPSAIEVVPARLANGATVDLVGASGPLDFDDKRRTIAQTGLWRWERGVDDKLVLLQVGTYAPVQEGEGFAWTLTEAQ